MARIILDEKIIKFSSLFESLTGARLKDCFIDDIIIFVVEPGEVAKAVGKNGFMARRLEHILKAKVKIVEYADNLIIFIQKLVFPANVREVLLDDGICTIIPFDLHSRGLMIGRDAKNLRNYERIVQRYFKIEELKVR